MTALLRLEGVVAGYGQAMVLRGVDLDVRAAAVTCLIGPNGAGKSTVLNTISGLLSPREGSITLNGRPIHGLSPRTVLESGVVHLPQERSLFPLMTVWENMLMGAYLVKDRRTAQRRVEQVAELYPLIGRRRHDRAGSLSGGEQRIVELARALLLDPLLVLMDEPSIGLAPQASRQVFDGIVAMRQAGQTVLLVEQNARCSPTPRSPASTSAPPPPAVCRADPAAGQTPVPAPLHRAACGRARLHTASSAVPRAAR